MQRDLLQALLIEKGLAPAELSRKAGFKRPNLIYNFLNGHTEHFNQDTLRKLSQALDVPVTQLMGVDPAVSVRQPDGGGLVVKALAAIGVWRDSFDLPLEEQFRAPLIVDQTMRGMGAYGIVVRGRGIEKVYPADSILVAIPLDSWDGTLSHGRKVVLQRIRDRVEVSIREIEVRDGHAYLWPRSFEANDPACILPVEMPWPAPARTWRRGDDRFLLAGVVVQSVRPEL